MTPLTKISGAATNGTVNSCNIRQNAYAGTASTALKPLTTYLQNLLSMAPFPTSGISCRCLSYSMNTYPSVAYIIVINSQ